jgi:hypothetical protein
MTATYAGLARSIDTGTFDEGSKDELAALVLRGRSEVGDGRCAECMPHRYIIQILEDAHAKGVDCACIGFALGLEGLNRG